MQQLRNKTEAAWTFARFIERFHLKAQQKKKQIRRMGATILDQRSVFKADPVLRLQKQNKKKIFLK